MLRFTGTLFSRTLPRARRSVTASQRRRRPLFDQFEERTLLSTGAIFTTTFDGIKVNANIYENKGDVYLNGGPQNRNAQGLDPGIYYFQVTNPSGSLLLSEDPASNRQLVVNADGRVAGALSGTTHANGVTNLDNGSTPVQLIPFGDTNNPGGEYKVWLVKADQATPETDIPDTDDDESRILDFHQGADVKTDNFRIKPGGPTDEQQTIAISGYKYYDTNTNGTRDADEPGIQGWKIDVTVTLPADSGLAFDAAGQIIIGAGDASHTFVSATSGDGSYAVALQLPAHYSANGVTFSSHEEFLDATWVQTGPLPGTLNPPGNNALADINRNWVGKFQTGSATGEVDASALDFGNVKLGQGGGLTLGFWSNKNGQKALTGSTTGTAFTIAAKAALNGLHLAGPSGALAKNINGDYFATYSAFNTWLLQANATNMAYMLSVQMAVMKLNTSIPVNGTIPVNGGSLVFAPGTTSANSNGFASVNVLIAEAEAELTLHPLTLSDSPFRFYQEKLKNAFDRANNNLTFVQGPITFVVFP